MTANWQAGTGMKATLLALGLGILGLATAANAAVVITTVGDGNGYDELNVEAFRSTSVAKGFDADGNDEYGTEGTFFFGTGATVGNGQPWSVHTQTGASWATFAAGANFGSVSEQTGYGPYDNPTLSGATVADWIITGIGVATGGGVGNWAEVLTFTIGSNAPKTFRVGIMSGLQGTGDGRWDPTGLRMSVDGGAATEITGLPNNGNNDPEWVFFDVVLNGETGGTFSIEGQNRLAAQGTALGGVTFDVPPISLIGDGTGYDEDGNSALSFRSMNVAKGFDADGDNAYGTAGYFFFGIGGGANISGQPFTRNSQGKPSWVTTFAAGANFVSVAEYSTYSPIDNPTLTPGVNVADWPRSAIGLSTLGGAGTWSEIMTFTVDSSAPAFLLGIMAGNEGAANGRWDPTGLRVSFNGGMPVAVTSLPIMNVATIGMVFFYVDTEGAAGTFSVEAQKRLATQGPSIAGLTFEKPTQGTLFMFQ